MPVIEWHQKLVLDHAEIDALHVEFVDLLNALADAADGDLVAALDAFIVHCAAHFGHEEKIMQDTGFPPLGCHQGEHDQVMQIVREVRRRLVEEGDVELTRNLAAELPAWFEQHATSMDYALTQYLKALSGKGGQVKALDLCGGTHGRDDVGEPGPCATAARG